MKQWRVDFLWERVRSRLRAWMDDGGELDEAALLGHLMVSVPLLLALFCWLRMRG